MEESGAFWKVRQSYVTITALIIGIGSLAALVISADGGHALATVALSLAILSFVIQIILFLAQGLTTNQQMFRAEQIHVLTTTALAAIAEKAESAHETLGRVERTIGERAIVAQTSTTIAVTDSEDVDVLRQQLSFERLYGVIFGSQLGLLRTLRNADTIDRTTAEQALAQARTDSRDAQGVSDLDGWTVDTYMTFLMLNDLARPTADLPPNSNFQFTDRGRAFIDYIDRGDDSVKRTPRPF